MLVTTSKDQVDESLVNTKNKEITETQTTPNIVSLVNPQTKQQTTQPTQAQSQPTIPQIVIPIKKDLSTVTINLSDKTNVGTNLGMI